MSYCFEDDDGFLQVSSSFWSTIWSPCTISKDSEYCIILQDLEAKGIFVAVPFLYVGMGCGRGRVGNPLEFFYL